MCKFLLVSFLSQSWNFTLERCSLELNQIIRCELWFKSALKTVRKNTFTVYFICAEKRNIKHHNVCVGAVSATEAWLDVTPDVSWGFITKIRWILLPAIIDLTDLEWDSAQFVTFICFLVCLELEDYCYYIQRLLLTKRMCLLGN